MSWRAAGDCLGGPFRQKTRVDQDFAAQTPSALPCLWGLERHNECHLFKPPLRARVKRQASMSFTISSFICWLCSSSFSTLYAFTSLSLITPLYIHFSFISDCEEVTPVHLRSVHPSPVPADACQLPRDDLGDCERPRAQDPLGNGQAHSFPRYRLERSLCDCPICHLSCPRPILVKLKWLERVYDFMRGNEVSFFFYLQGEHGGALKGIQHILPVYSIIIASTLFLLITGYLYHTQQIMFLELIKTLF